jgi:uncharacterized membrane protein
MTLVPILALGNAALSAASTIFIRQGLRKADAFTGFWINLIVGAVGMWIAVLATGSIGHVSRTGVLIFVIAGLLGTVGGRLLRFLSIEKVGASIASAVGNLQPMISTTLAILILGEQVTIPILTGTIVIVVGTVLLSISRGGTGFRPALIVFPLMSATCFGAVQVLRKAGLAHMGPVMATAVNYTAALIAFSALMLSVGHRGILTCRGRTLAQFVLSGIAENGAVFLLIVALSIGKVSVVTPLTASAPIFVLLLSPFFLRGLEIVNARVITGTLLIVVGVAVITTLGGR